MTDAADDRLRMQDPRMQYPRPPFPKQPQSAPGLAGAMDPKPDHGETSYRGYGRLKGRKALVTGSDSGIGRAAAIAFAREGADVALSYLADEQADAEEVRSVIEAEGRTCVMLPGDITDEGFCLELVAQATAGLGGLDILVNNAGKQTNQSDVDDITSEQFDRTMKTNLYAMFWITKAALKHMPAGASIINTASVQGFSPSKGLVDYATTKAGIIAFSEALAKQQIERGIRVNVVAPGPVLDRPAALRRPAAGEGAEVRRRGPARAPRSAGGMRADLRVPGLAGGELRHRRGLCGDGRQGHDLTQAARSAAHEPPVWSAPCSTCRSGVMRRGGRVDGGRRRALDPVGRAAHHP